MINKWPLDPGLDFIQKKKETIFILFIKKLNMHLIKRITTRKQSKNLKEEKGHYLWDPSLIGFEWDFTNYLNSLRTSLIRNRKTYETRNKMRVRASLRQIVRSFSALSRSDPVTSRKAWRNGLIRDT